MEVMKIPRGQKGWSVEGIRMVGLGECWVCAEFISRKRLRLGTLGKLGRVLHVRKNEGINYFLVPCLTMFLSNYLNVVVG
jgi:hypothetical protein